MDEIKLGRMLGGKGQDGKVVEQFLGSKFFIIPCGAVPKGHDPHGRIIHDFSYARDGENSINSALLENSVEYISFRDRVQALSKIKWYISVDMKNGYRQLPLHPSECHTQLYSLGPYEHYIDLCMPFGKANSSKIFCKQLTNWCVAFKSIFLKIVP